MANLLTSLKDLKHHALYSLVRKQGRAYGWGITTLIFVDVINVILPLLIREGLDAIPQKRMVLVLLAGGLIFFLMSLQSVGRYLWRLLLIGAANQISSGLRRDLYAHLQRLPLTYYQKIRTGDLMSRATSDVESVRMAVGPGILVAADAVIMFVLIIPVMFWLSPKLTGLAFAFYPLVPFLTRRLGQRIETLFEKLQVRLSSVSAFAQESFGAIRLIKSLTLEDVSAKRFRALSRDYAVVGEELARVEALFSPALGLITNLGTFLILVVGGLDMISGALTLGTFVAFQRFVVQLSWPMEAIGWAVTLNREGSAAFSRLQSIFTVSPVPRVQPRQPLRDHSIEIRNLDFSYDNNFSLKLENLRVSPGQKIGLVGPVGSGKTTLFNCLLRLYEPACGSIFLGGIDITEISHDELRRKVGSVEQQVFLFSESILANIGMGAALPQYEKVAHAMSVAGIIDEVQSLTEGAQSVLGERGVNLSGGQKSRLALARALVRNPSVLILDDCFSHVDVDVESRIIQSLFEHYPHLTILVASHRLSIMPRLDEIWVLDKGRLLDLGTHSELLKRSRLYQSLWLRAATNITVAEVGL